MEKYLKFDDQVTVLTKHKELQQYLQFRKENMGSAIHKRNNGGRD